MQRFTPDFPPATGKLEFWSRAVIVCNRLCSVASYPSKHTYLWGCSAELFTVLSTYIYKCQQTRRYCEALKVQAYFIHPPQFAACITTWSYRLLLHVDSCIIHAMYTMSLCMRNACQTGVTPGTSVQLPSGRRWVRLRLEGPAVTLATGDRREKILLSYPRDNMRHIASLSEMVRTRAGTQHVPKRSQELQKIRKLSRKNSGRLMDDK